MEQDIKGIMVYYYAVCRRKLWYFSRDICMEHTDENVSIGKIIDENSYGREDKHISINNVINIDFIKKDNILHEVKKSKKIEKASISQVKYYLYYLKKQGLTGVSGKIDYPLLKQSVDVRLEDGDEEKIEEMLMDIKRIISEDLPPDISKIGICKKCAYYDICYI